MLDMVNRGHNNPNGKDSRKPFKWILVDSAIIALIAMAIVMPERIPNAQDLYTMFKAFLAAFIYQLAVERGIKKA